MHHKGREHCHRVHQEVLQRRSEVGAGGGRLPVPYRCGQVPAETHRVPRGLAEDRSRCRGDGVVLRGCRARVGRAPRMLSLARTKDGTVEITRECTTVRKT